MPIQNPNDLQQTTNVGAVTTRDCTFNGQVAGAPVMTVTGPGGLADKIESWKFAGVEGFYSGTLLGFPGILSAGLFFFADTTGAQAVLINPGVSMAVWGPSLSIGTALGTYNFQCNTDYLQFLRGHARLTRRITGNTTLATTDDYVACDSTGAAFTVTIPTAAIVDGRIFTIKDEGAAAAANNVTIVGQAGETIDNAASFVLTQKLQSVTLIARNSKLWVI